KPIDDQAGGEDQRQRPDAEEHEERDGPERGQARLVPVKARRPESNPSPRDPNGPDDDPGQLDLVHRRARQHHGLKEVVEGHGKEREPEGRGQDLNEHVHAYRVNPAWAAAYGGSSRRKLSASTPSRRDAS